VVIVAGNSPGLCVYEVKSIRYALVRSKSDSTLRKSCPPQEIENRFLVARPGCMVPNSLLFTPQNINSFFVDFGLVNAPSQGYRFGDMTRGLVKGVGNILLGETRKYVPNDLELEISYVPFPSSQTKAQIASALAARLRAKGLLSDRGLDSAEYTFYKLSEWMQVEILTGFAASLEHTPWYRYPFMDTLKLYFSVLAQETLVVYKKLGPEKALLSMAFVTDVVPGIVMTLLMGQLALLVSLHYLLALFGLYLLVVSLVDCLLVSKEDSSCLFVLYQFLVVFDCLGRTVEAGWRRSI
jgi:hypothetical protein